MADSMETPYVFGTFHLDRQANRLTENGAPVAIADRALGLLRILIEHAGTTVTKAELLKRVWPSAIVDESNLRVQIASLRRVLRDGVDGRRFIVNITGRGYMFVLGGETAPAEDVVRQDEASTDPAQSWNSPTGSAVIGRDEFVQELITDIEKRRAVSLVGAGGIGKTTVAHRVIEAMRDRFRDGMAFVDLSTLTEPAHLARTVLARLGIAASADDALKVLEEKLAARQMLLTLDNCEHLADPVAHLAETLVRSTAELRILVTSREPLRIDGEWVRRLPPLDIPPENIGDRLEDAVSYSAFRLFAERAGAVMDGFNPTRLEIAAIAAICRQLDGLPLAIELAAAHADTFGIEGLLAQIRQRFALLVQGRRTALPRHKTLKATLDWSFELLSPEARQMLLRFATFTGSFSFDAATAVCLPSGAEETDLYDIISELVIKNMLVADLAGLEARYRLLQTTLDYCRDKFDESPERDEIGSRHMAYWRTMLDRAAKDWNAMPLADWRLSYGERVDDFRGVLDWCYRSPERTDLAVALTVDSAPLWFQMSMIDEFRDHALKALDNIRENRNLIEDGGAREMQVNMLLGHLLCHTRGVTTETTSAWGRALQLADQRGRPGEIAQACAANWLAAYSRGEYALMIDLANRFAAAAGGVANPNAGFIRDRMRATAMHFLGRQDETKALCDVVLNQPLARVDFGYNSGHTFDARVSMSTILARLTWLRGETAAANAILDDAIRLGLEDGGALTVAYVYAFAAGPIAFWEQKWDLLAERMAFLRQHTSRYAIMYWHAWGDVLGRVAEWQLAGGNEAARPRLPGELQPLFVAQLAETLACGDPEFLSAAVIRRAESGLADWCLSEVIRIKAEKLLATRRACGGRSGSG
ncbi:ATP-binding protein [Neorhizobium galegae]|uniref:ATP-binding protein n=1 Tax=Neorhizobium galegae TaxID=399 RepID=UPI001F410D6B|nr:winged helix-turn-helix domain-containing protein [Neorhizobium galegae]UIK04785.1 helix-turn-helix transcriptional regulator [Neorhizobium galegae]